MTNMSKPLREKLSKVCEVRLPEVIYEDFSKDGTRKWVMRMDGAVKEAKDLRRSKITEQTTR